MTKVVISCFILIFSLNAFSVCEVYGISDSPQKLSCTFNGKKLNLRCAEGNYYLNKLKVNMAYHLEVEEGPTPLVFKTSRSQLTVTMKTKASSEAELEIGRSLLRGTCN